MNPESKLFLILLGALFVGLALVAYGLGLTSKPAYTAVGLLTFFAALRGLSLLWGDRR
jgi:hypothetical protein